MSAAAPPIFFEFAVRRERWADDLRNVRSDVGRLAADLARTPIEIPIRARDELTPAVQRIIANFRTQEIVIPVRAGGTGGGGGIAPPVSGYFAPAVPIAPAAASPGSGVSFAWKVATEPVVPSSRRGGGDFSMDDMRGLLNDPRTSETVRQSILAQVPELRAQAAAVQPLSARPRDINPYRFARASDLRDDAINPTRQAGDVAGQLMPKDARLEAAADAVVANMQQQGRAQQAEARAAQRLADAEEKEADRRQQQTQREALAASRASARASSAAARDVDRAGEINFREQLRQASPADRVRMLQDRLGAAEPGTAEHASLQAQLNQASEGTGFNRGQGLSIGRGLTAVSIVRGLSELASREEQFRLKLSGAGNVEDVIGAQIAHRRETDSLFFGVGRIGRLVRESVPGGGPSAEDVETQLQDVQRGREHGDRVRQLMMSGRSFGRQYDVAVSGEGYRRSIASATAERGQRDETLRENELQYTDAEGRRLDAQGAAATAKHDYENSALFNVTHPFNFTAGDDDNYQQTMKGIDQERQSMRDTAAKRTATQLQQSGAMLDAKKAEIEHAADVGTKTAAIELHGATQLLAGRSRGSVEIDMARQRDAMNAGEYQRSMRPDQAAAQTAADAAKTSFAARQQQQDQALDYGQLEYGAQAFGLRRAGFGDLAHQQERNAVFRLQENAEPDAQRRGRLQALHGQQSQYEDEQTARRRGYEESRTQAAERAPGAEAGEQFLAASGREFQASLDQLARTIKERVEAIRDAARAEPDAVRRQQFERQAVAEERAAPTRIAAEQVRHQRQIEDEVTQIRESANEMRLRAEHRYYEASEAALSAHYDRLIKKAKEAGEEQEAAELQKAKAAAESERQSIHDRDVTRTNRQADSLGARNTDRPARGQLIDLAEEIRESEEDAKGDPAKLAAVRQLNQQKLIALRKSLTPEPHARTVDREGLYFEAQSAVFEDPDGRRSREYQDRQKTKSDIDAAIRQRQLQHPDLPGGAGASNPNADALHQFQNQQHAAGDKLASAADKLGAAADKLGAIQLVA